MKSDESDPIELPGRAWALVAAAEAAVADLERRLPAGMGPGELVEAARIREATYRLCECAAELAREELMVRGSTGQRRSHPLLKVEQDLRKEISEGVQKLTFRVEQRAMFERLQAAHRARRSPADTDGVE
jgi:hypothetical protein